MHFLFIALTIPLISFAEIKVHPDCKFFTSDKPNSKLLNNWVNSPGTVQIIKGKKIPGGTSIITGKSADTYLTDYFFKESKMGAPEEALEDSLGTYAYYQQDAKVKWKMEDQWGSMTTRVRSNRGGGRDHFIELDSEKNNFLAVKGSGTNTRFSKSNSSDWNINDFRRNGLMLLEDGILEYIIAKQFESAGVAILGHPDLVMFPKSFYDELVANGVNKKKYMVQMHRQLSSPRESFSVLTTPTKNERNHKHEGVYKLISDMGLLNAAHGAINPENMVYGGKLIDMGHVSFGYPYSSYSYRCTLCQGARGGSGDRTLIGLVDHYFGNNVFGGSKRSYSAEMTKVDYQKILNQSAITLSEDKNLKPKITLTDAEKESLDKLFKEQIVFMGAGEKKDFYKEKLNQQYFDLFGIDLNKKMRIREEGWGGYNTVDEWDYIWPHKFSLSYKFIWQLSSQKLFLNQKQFDNFIKSTQGLIPSKYKEDFNNLIALFSRIIDEQKLSKKSVDQLFFERLPSNLLLRQIQRRLKKKRSYNTVITEAQKLIKDFIEPVRYPPKKFRADVTELANHIDEKSQEYIQNAIKKAEDRLNGQNSDDWHW